MHQTLDHLNWPVALCSFSIIPFLQHLMETVPGPTTIYTVISAAFMLFQMSDRLGLLDRFKAAGNRRER